MEARLSAGKETDDGRDVGRSVGLCLLPLVLGDELLISLPVITRRPPGRRREGLPDFGND